MDNSLRHRIIRLAHENPELRPHLLPLVREATQEKEAASAQAISAARQVLELVREGMQAAHGLGGDEALRSTLADIIVAAASGFRGADRAIGARIQGLATILKGDGAVLRAPSADLDDVSEYHGYQG